MIIYLHGLNSSAQSTKARQLGEAMAARGRAQEYLAPSLPHRPAQAIAQVETELEAVLAKTPQRCCFVGSSLGGFYATYLAHKHGARAVLINPAVHAHVGLRAYLGRQVNLYTGEAYELGEDHLREWQALYVERADPSRFLLFVETGDEVLDYRLAIKYYEGAAQVVIPGGDHSFQSFVQHIPAILEFADRG